MKEVGDVDRNRRVRTSYYDFASAFCHLSQNGRISSRSQELNPLQQCGLSAVVLPDQQVDLRQALHLVGLEATVIGDFNTSQHRLGRSLTMKHLIASDNTSPIP